MPNATAITPVCAVSSPSYRGRSKIRRCLKARHPDEERIMAGKRGRPSGAQSRPGLWFSAFRAEFLHLGCPRRRPHRISSTVSVHAPPMLPPRPAQALVGSSTFEMLVGHRPSAIHGRRTGVRDSGPPQEETGCVTFCWPTPRPANRHARRPELSAEACRHHAGGRSRCSHPTLPGLPEPQLCAPLTGRPRGKAWVEGLRGRGKHAQLQA